MLIRTRLVLVLILMCGCAAGSVSQEDGRTLDLSKVEKLKSSVSQEDGRPFDLSEVEGLKSLEDENARALLAKNGFVVRSIFYKQIFEPYIGCGLPKYVTTDSVFRTYHVILEEAVSEMENLNAETIAQFSMKAADASLKMRSDAKTNDTKKAALMLAAYFSLAAKLAGDGYKLDNRIKETVNGELRNISAGAFGVSAVFDTKFDYGIFKPRGIYAGKPELEKYFRIMILYGCFGFRVRSKEETLAAALLVKMFTENPGLKKMHSQVQKCYRYFIGEPDDLALEEYEKVYEAVFGKDPGERKFAANLPKFQQALRKLRDPRINDQLLYPKEWHKFKENTKGLRLFGVKYVPDGELFQDMVDDKNLMPSGLYVASVLGSPSARRILEETKGAEFTKRLDASSVAFRKRLANNNYGKTLKCLQLLVADPPEGAPRFMRKKAWKDREAFGMLACWASIRHTWVLQTKMAMMVFCVHENAKEGFVEARPDFFKALRTLAEETADKLELFKAGRLPGIKPQVGGIIEVAEIIERLIEKPETATEDDKVKIMGYGGVLQEFLGLGGDESQLPGRLKNLKDLCQKILENRPVKEEERKRLAEALVLSDCPGQMKKLAELLDRLEVMARKQLEGKEFSKEENELLEDYGETLAHLAFYEHNSYEIPQDDMPLVADVYSNPLIGKVLEVGIGKAMPIYVIMEDGGKQYLCKGAVMSYYEFHQPIANRLNDEQWRKIVRDGKAVLPEWSSSFISKQVRKSGEGKK